MDQRSRVDSGHQLEEPGRHRDGRGTIAPPRRLRRFVIAVASAAALFFGYVLVVTEMFPADTPVVTGAQTREDGYQIMRQFLLSSGATEADGVINIDPLPCNNSPWSRRTSPESYYCYSVMGGFRAVGDNQHEAFRRMYEHARANGFTVSTYKNPTSAPLDGRIRSWQMSGGSSADHGFGFSIFTVHPQTHVAIMVGSTCRVTPDRDDDIDSPFTLPGLPLHVPAEPPIWNNAPTPSPAPTTTPSPTPTAPPVEPNSPPPPTGSPLAHPSGPTPLDRIRDILG